VERKPRSCPPGWVFDRGIVSEENLERLRRVGASIWCARAQLKVTSADC